MGEIFIFLIGLAVGSFLNCLIYRLEINQSFFKRRSYCPNCKKILGWLDLIPVLSFIFLKGKCRYCHQKISWQYPLVELSSGFLFLLIFILQPISTLSQFITTLCLFVLSSFLIVIFVYDLKHYIIPDKVIYPAIGVAFLYQLFGILEFRIGDFRPSPKQVLGGGEFRTFGPFLNPLFSAFIVSFFFLLIILISKGRWMGMGDFKLSLLMGLVLGFPNILVALFLAFFLGAIIGIGLILAGKKTLKSQVPFGPFLVSGTFIALFLGNKIINWYFNFFN